MAAVMFWKNYELHLADFRCFPGLVAREIRRKGLWNLKVGCKSLEIADFGI